jgi:hypothetical protein
MAQFSVFRNVALNTVAIGLQFSSERLKFTASALARLPDRGSPRHVEPGESSTAKPISVSMHPRGFLTTLQDRP